MRESGGPDRRVTELGLAVARLRSELDAYPKTLADRRTAEVELDALARQVARGTPQPPCLRHSLLLIAAAVGSVSALSDALADVRAAIDLYNRPREATRAG